MAVDVTSLGLRAIGGVYTYCTAQGVGVSTTTRSITTGTYKSDNDVSGTFTLTVTCPTCEVQQFTQAAGICYGQDSRAYSNVTLKVPASGRYLVWNGTASRSNTGTLWQPSYTWSGSVTVGGTNARVISGGGTGYSKTSETTNSSVSASIVAYRVE